MLDSSQASYRSDDGSTAIFDLSGTDTDMNHLESKTAIVSLYEFRCSHSFYNVDNTCNILELFVQYTNSSRIMQSGTSILITIPNGAYDLESILERINDEITEKCAKKTINGKDVYTGFTQLIEDEDANGKKTSRKIKFQTPLFQELELGIDATHNYYYSGFYLVMDNYPNLAHMLGFLSTFAYDLPCLTPKKGYGVTFQQIIDSTTNEMTYSVTDRQVNFYDQYIPHIRKEIPDAEASNAVAILSLGLVSLEYPRDIYVCVESVRTKNRCSNHLIPMSNIIAKVPFDAVFGDVYSYLPSLVGEFYVPSLKLDTMTIRLYDEDGKPLFWNGGNWSVTLSVKYSMDAGNTGMEDTSLGRTYRPSFHQEMHDPLMTMQEHSQNKRRRN